MQACHLWAGSWGWEVLAHFGLLAGWRLEWRDSIGPRLGDSWEAAITQRQDLRHDYRDLSGDYARVNASLAIPSAGSSRGPAEERHRILA